MTLTYVLNSIAVSLLILTVLLALIYSIPLLLVHRLRHHLNMYSLNVCLSTSVCSLFWIYIYAVTTINVRQLYTIPTCTMIAYLQVAFTIQIPLSLIVVSLHRYCFIVHQAKRFFRTKRWTVICFVSQWLAGFLLPAPLFIRDYSVSTVA